MNFLTLLNLIIIIVIFITPYSEAISKEYAEVEVIAKHQNNADIKVHFYVKPSAEDRLVFTSLSIDMARKIFDETHFVDASIYGWLIKQNEENQLWVGKFIKAGQTSDTLTIRIPAVEEKQAATVVDSTKYNLFISLRPMEIVASFLSDSDGSVSYLPIYKATLKLANDIKATNLADWRGWEMVWGSTWEWSLEHNSDPYLYAKFEWSSPAEQIIMYIIVPVLGFAIGVVVIFGFVSALIPQKAVNTVANIVFLLILSGSFVVWYFGYFGDLMAIGFVGSAVGCVIAPHLSPRMREAVEKLRG